MSTSQTDNEKLQLIVNEPVLMFMIKPNTVTCYKM